jgi:uncharacterized protein (TIGR02594 family)
MSIPVWLAKAQSYIGVHETDLPQHANPQILKWLDEADGHAGDGKTLQNIHDDATPWCATFVSAILEECGIVSARTAWAPSYAHYGQSVQAAVGAIVVFPHHVTFLAGRDKAGHILCVGGNQSDMVRMSAFNPQAVVAYRWPLGQAIPAQQSFLALPYLDGAPPSMKTT